MIVEEYRRMLKESDEFVIFVKNYKIVSIYGFVRIIFFKIEKLDGSFF